jgi:hypothetical protein
MWCLGGYASLFLSTGKGSQIKLISIWAETITLILLSAFGRQA